MKKLYSIIITIFLFSTAYANNARDSLIHLLNKKEEREKLDLLRQISTSSQEEDKLAAIIALENEAKKQSNDLYLVVAYQHRAIFYSFRDYEQSIVYFNKAIDKLDKISPYKVNPADEQLYYRVSALLSEWKITSLTRGEKGNLALIRIKKMLDDGEYGKNRILEQTAYTNMGLMYLYSKKYKEALVAYQTSLHLLHAMPDEYIKGREFDPYTGIIGSNISLKNYNVAIYMCDTLIDIVNKDYSKDALAQKTLSYIVYGLYADAYLGKKDTRSARLYIDKCLALLPYTKSEYLQNSYLYLYNMHEAQYYLEEKNYQTANKYIDNAIEISKELPKNSYMYVSEPILIKTKILRGLGQKDESLDILYKLYEANDSITNSNFSGQVAELQTIYKVDKLKNEAKLNQAKLHNTQILLMASIVITILLLIVIYMIWRGNRKKNERNRLLFEKNLQLDNKNRLIEELKGHTGNKAKIRETADQNQKIIVKLDKYMKESEAFKNPDLTRDYLALHIGTNRQYMIEAIRSKKNQTFNEYIYSFRIEYAYKLLIEDETMPIADIQFESGFTSQPVFNTEFKNTYSMTPSELRKVAIEQAKKK